MKKGALVLPCGARGDHRGLHLVAGPGGYHAGGASRRCLPSGGVPGGVHAGARVRVWLDDVRPAPEGWVWVKTAEEAKRLIASSIDVTDVSLDNDLGRAQAGQGAEVAEWYSDTLRRKGRLTVGGKVQEPPFFYVHSENTVARARMERALLAAGYVRTRTVHTYAVGQLATGYGYERGK